MKSTLQKYILCMVVLAHRAMFSSEEQKEAFMPKKMTHESLILTIDGRPAHHIALPAPYVETAASHVAPIIAHFNPERRQQVIDLLCEESACAIIAAPEVEKAALIVGMVQRGLDRKNAALRATLEQQRQEQIESERRRLRQTSCRWMKKWSYAACGTCIISGFWWLSKTTCHNY